MLMTKFILILGVASTKGLRYFIIKMEMYEYKIQELLFKFSHSNIVLGYYGNVFEAQVLMNSLCSKTRKEYKQNKFAYL